MAYLLSAISVLLILFAARATAQVSAGVEVLGVSFGGTTYYGEYRTYSASVIAVGQGPGSFAGNITFVCGTTVLAEAPLVPTTALQVSPNQLATSLQISLLNQYIAQTGLVLPGITTVTAQNLDTPVVQTLLNSLSPITVDGGAIASVTTPYTPVMNCTQATVLYSGMTYGGQPVYGSPLFNPLLPATAFQFQVLPTYTNVTIPAGDVISAPFNSSVVLTVGVIIMDSNSVLPPNGGTVTVAVVNGPGRKLLQGTVIGTGPVVTAASGVTSFAQVLISTGPPLAAGTSAALQVLFSGNTDFLPSSLPFPGYSLVITASGTAPTYSSTTPPPSSLAPPSAYATTTTVAVQPAASAFVGGPVTISGAVTAGAGHPTGSVVVTSNGVTLSAVAVDPTTGAYTVTSSAPDQPGVDVITATFIPAPGSPYQASPTAQVTLPVTEPGVTFTNLAANPDPAVAGTPVVLTGTVTGANGVPPTGTVQALVNGALVPGIADLVPLLGGGSSTFTLPINAPGTVGVANVTFVYLPGAGFSGPSTLPSITLGVTGAPPNITVTPNPNPVKPGGNLTVSGTVVSTASGSPAGTVTVTLAGKTYSVAVVPGAHYGESTFSLVIPAAPANIGVYPLAVHFTPAIGSSTGAGSAATTVVVSNFAGTADAHLTVSGDSNATTVALSFPDCRKPLAVNVGTTAAPGLGYPNGTVTLAVTGGGLGTNTLTLGSGTLLGGQAAFTVKSAEVHHDILAQLAAKLASHGLAKQHALPALVPAGHVLLLPGTYTLVATYSGSDAYAPGTATIPLIIPAACGLVDLYL